MKAILKLEAAFDAIAHEIVPPEMESMGGPPVLRRQRKRSTLRDRVRSTTVFRLIVMIFCLSLFFATQRWLAALFNDELAALFVAATVAITVVGIVKPVFTPKRRR